MCMYIVHKAVREICFVRQPETPRTITALSYLRLMREKKYLVLRKRKKIIAGSMEEKKKHDVFMTNVVMIC